jgi:hypothetical protein
VHREDGLHSVVDNHVVVLTNTRCVATEPSVEYHSCEACPSHSRGGSLASYIDTQNAFLSVHSAAPQLPLT